MPFGSYGFDAPTTEWQHLGSQRLYNQPATARGVAVTRLHPRKHAKSCVPRSRSTRATERSWPGAPPAALRLIDPTSHLGHSLVRPKRFDLNLEFHRLAEPHL